MKKVVFTFGRMNPPTSGHQLLVNKLMAYAKMHSGIPRVYLSHSIGKKDPLPYDIKVSFARKAFGAIVRKSPAKNIIQILKDLEKEKFTDVTLVVGSDRVQEFKKLLNAYNGKEYNFDNISVVSAGERDPDADDVSGMSASKMRALVKDNNLSSFVSGAPSTLKAMDRKKLFNSVRKFMLGEDVMDYSHDERFVSFIVEASNDDSDISMPSNEEIERYLQGVSVEDLDLADEDAFLYDVITGEAEPDEVQESKVLSVQARQKLSQRMKFMSKRLARLRQIKSKTMPAQQRLRMRARKAALMILRRRATGKQNLDYSALSRSQRVAVDNALVNRFGKSLGSAVDRISKRILPNIRKKAQASVAQAREVKESYLYEREAGKEGSPRDIATDKIQAAKRGISVADWEKTKSDAAHDSPLNIDPTKLNTLEIDATKNDRASPNPKQGHLHLNRKLSHYARSVDEGRKSSSDKDARDAGDTNIIYQMRKTINSRGEHETEFADGNKAQISIPDAKKIIAKFDSLRMPTDRQRFTIVAGQSLKNFKDVLAHGLPKEQKKKISLGGKKVNEFYLGVGRNRTASPYDGDEPPGTRRVAEAAKDEDRPEDPNRSRPLSQKLDLLLRLGIADSGDLQKYRRALRSSKKQALQSPEMREKLADLLDKLIDLTTQDPATYSRVRYRVMTKEAMSLLNKAEASGIDISILGEVFARGYQLDNDINEAFARVNSFIAGGKAAEMDNDLNEKRGLWDNIHAKRERIKAGSKERMRAPGSKGAPTNAAIKASQTEDNDPCWDTHKQVGMKKKGGRMVPNCVPKEQNSTHEPIPLSKRVTRVKSFHVWHPPLKEGQDLTHKHPTGKIPYANTSNKELGAALTKTVTKSASESVVNEAQRTADVKIVKVRMPDGTMKFRKEKSTTSVQDESYTGSEPTSSNKNDPSNRFVGTDAIRRNYASSTPGQEQVAGEISVAAFSPEKPSYASPGVRRATNEIDQSKQDAGQKSLKDIRKALSGIRESRDIDQSFDDAMNEAIYQGREVPLGKPMKGDVKKSKVYVRDPVTGNIKKVNFGDKTLSIKKDQPARKKSYCARSGGQGNLTKKTSANYWSRRAWNC